jgi:tetratricopeptide (TPR) repeat protein
MSAIAAGAVGGPDAARAWDERALAEVDRSDDPAAEAWRGTILNNLGWDLHDSGHLDEALDVFERAVTARVDAGQHERILVARWCVGRALRSLGRYDEALALMRTLAADPEGARDEYVHEEIAANVAALAAAES